MASRKRSSMRHGFSLPRGANSARSGCHFFVWFFIRCMRWRAVLMEPGVPAFADHSKSTIRLYNRHIERYLVDLVAPKSPTWHDSQMDATMNKKSTFVKRYSCTIAVVDDHGRFTRFDAQSFGSEVEACVISSGTRIADGELYVFDVTGDAATHDTVYEALEADDRVVSFSDRVRS